MLDITDFVTDRGGNPNKIKESQRKRFAPESAVDEVITLYEEARRGIIGLEERRRAGYADISLIQHDMRWGKSAPKSMLSSKRSGKKRRLGRRRLFLFTLSDGEAG